jgi:hypothetical protein
MSNYFLIFFSKLLDYFSQGTVCAFWVQISITGCCTPLQEPPLLVCARAARDSPGARGETGLSIVLAADPSIKLDRKYAASTRLAALLSAT